MLKENKVKEYWKERANKFNEQAVGFDCSSAEKQDMNYSIRKKFIFSSVNRNLNTLDYGCGIGRYAQEFNSEYIGVDITGKLLEIAIKNNPNRLFVQLAEPWLSGIFNNDQFQSMTQIFTATVLQHCDDDLVIKIMKSWNNLENVIIISLYENNDGKRKEHVIGRQSLEYYELLEKSGYKIKHNVNHTHTIHNEIHTLSIFQV